jgi:uncharacterized membrane protein YbhN (UPF0104 family)
MNWRRLLTVIGLSLFVWFIVREHNNLQPAWDSVRHLSIGWLVGLLILEIGYYCFNASATQSALAFFGLVFPWRKLMLIGMETIYLNSVVPSVGLAGIAPLWEHATDTKQSKKLTASGYILTTVMEVTAISILWLGLVVSTPYRLALAIGVPLLLLGLPHLFRRTTHLARSLTWAFLANACEATLLYFLFQAMHYPVSVETSLLVYSVSMLAWYLSPTPQGLGTVELLASAVLVKSGLPAGAALAIPLTYRLFVQLVPVTIGLISFSLRQQSTRHKLVTPALES